LKSVRYLLFLSLFSMLWSCSSTRYLKDGEYLLIKQKIKGSKGLDSEDLEVLYRQKPNIRFPVSYVWLYQWGLKNYDTSKIQQQKIRITKKYEAKIAKHVNNQRKINNLTTKMLAKQKKKDKKLTEGNWRMRSGERLAVYDSLITNETTGQFKKYLHSKGYFHAKTFHEVKIKNRKASVTYTLEKGIAHQFEKITYQSTDSAVLILIQTNSLLETGKDYDQNLITDERERIYDLLKNNGYYDFNKQYIVFEVDTLKRRNFANIKTLINTPQGKTHHKKFYIDSVIFRTDADITLLKNDRSEQHFNEITYEHYKKRFSKRVLDSKLFIYPGRHYSRKNVFDTQRQLANLDIFRLVTVNYDTAGNKMDVRIFASPLKKFEMSHEFGLGVNVTQGFPGPFYNVSFKNRNIFGGLEILEFNGRVGVEGLPVGGTTEKEIDKSQQISGNFSLTFPQFIIPFGYKLRSKLGTINPKTRITIGDNYVKRADYTRNNISGSVAYQWQAKNKQFIFTLDEISIINSTVSESFQTELDQRRLQGSNLFRSFEPSVVSSISLLTNINFNKYGEQNNKAAFLKIFLESGGTSLALLESAVLDKIFTNQQYYQYLKFNFDFRRTLPISRITTLAYRLNIGVAKPYGSNNVLPYEKYFFAGGSSGIRAWRPRRLGPGSYNHLTDDNTYDIRIEQFGEILLQTSVELRRNLFGFVDGALFLDAGNIWIFDKQSDRLGGDFDKNRFYKEIAVGGGVGLRFDFSFLILRFDGAFKIVDPARPEGARFVFSKNYKNTLYDAQEPFVFNLGIGFPF